MVTVCPSCTTTIGFDGPSPSNDVNIRCSRCNSVFKIIFKGPAPASARECSPPARTFSVLVANPERSFCTAVGRVLGETEFTLTFCHDGPSTLAAIHRMKPDVALVDVALPGLYGFQICEAVRSDTSLSGVRLIVTTSLHDTRRYIRSPASLYGADALIHKHEIAGSLRSLVWTLITKSSAVGTSATESGLIDDGAKAVEETVAGTAMLSASM